MTVGHNVATVGTSETAVIVSRDGITAVETIGNANTDLSASQSLLSEPELAKSSKSSPFIFVGKGPAAEATDAPQPVMKMKTKMISFFIFPSNGTPVE